MLLSPKAYKSLSSKESISCYSPTNVSNDEKKHQFYMELTKPTRSIPKHNILIGGDMNARISKRKAQGSTYNKVTNENGQCLLDYMQECRLKALNTLYRKRKGKLWTHVLPNGTKFPN